ncbi:MAG: MFS transporter [Caldilinea sp.]|nr:MFS transporter [Caldilinea sp.]
MSSSASTMPAGADNGVPQRAGIILTTLIIVAAVANLPLAMANVALPSIGAYFQASQTQLNLVAVAYSLGLACSVLWLGALGDRYGRKQIAMLGVALAIPAALICGFAPSIQVLIAGRLFGGFAAGMAYPTTLALIAALWGAGAARTSAIALWAAIGGVRPVDLRAAAGELSLELGLLCRPAGGARGPLHGMALPALARQRDGRAGRQYRRHPVGRACGRLCPGDQLCAGSGHAHAGAWAAARHCRRAGALRAAPAPRREPSIRPEDCRPSHLLGGGGGRHHRLWLAHGLPLHRPAVLARCAGLLDRQRRPGDLAGSRVHDRRGATLGQDGGGTWRTFYPAGRLSLRAAGLCLDVALLERGHLLLACGHWLRAGRRRRGPGRHARLALADRLGAGDARRHGVGHGGPSARPGRCAHAVDLWGVAGRRLCNGHDRLHRRDRAEQPGARHRHRRIDHVLCRRAGDGNRLPAICRANHSRGQGCLSGRRHLRLSGRHHRRADRRSAGLLLLSEAR